VTPRRTGCAHHPGAYCRPRARANSSMGVLRSSIRWCVRIDGTDDRTYSAGGQAAAGCRVEPRALRAQSRTMARFTAPRRRRRGRRARRAHARARRPGSPTARAMPTARSSTRGTAYAVPPDAPGLHAAPHLAVGGGGAAGTTAGSPTRASGRSATSRTCARCSAARTGPNTSSVNERFAEAIDEELADPGPRSSSRTTTSRSSRGELRRRRPDARTALFWHIPWPHPDRLRICPWRREIMTGLLANDLLAFQLERDRRNFLLGVRDELPAQVDAGSCASHGRDTHVVSAPIGVDYDRIVEVAADPALADETARLRRELRLDAPIDVGWASIASTTRRGSPSGSRRSIDCSPIVPSCAGGSTFVQVGVPSRSELESYASIEAEIDQKVADINAAPRLGARRGPDPLPQGGAEDPAPRGALPHGGLLRRQLAARRHEPRGEGVHRGARRRRRRAGAQRDDGGRARAGRGAHHQSVRHRRVRRRSTAPSRCPRRNGARGCARCGASSPGTTCSCGPVDILEGSRT
jgi:hypothetical protein